MVRLRWAIVVKSGKFVRLSEAATMQHVATNTTMPVPKNYCVFEHKDLTYIVTSVIRGRLVGYGWVDRPPESKDRILSQLKGYVSQIRTLSTRHDGNCGGVQGNNLMILVSTQI
jgi:hypothetical protein